MWTKAITWFEEWLFPGVNEAQAKLEKLHDDAQAKLEKLHDDCRNKNWNIKVLEQDLRELRTVCDGLKQRLDYFESKYTRRD